MQKESNSPLSHRDRSVTSDDFEPFARPNPGIRVGRASVTNVHVKNERWNQVVDLRQAAATDRVYQIDRKSGLIRFGDGEHGGRPPAGSSVRVDYRYGEGRDGIDISIQYEHGVRLSANLWLRVSPDSVVFATQRPGRFACLRRWLQRTSLLTSFVVVRGRPRLPSEKRPAAASDNPAFDPPLKACEADREREGTDHGYGIDP